MSESEHNVARPTDPVGRVLWQITSVLAVLGGALCCFMAAMITVSVTGRYLFAAPIPGDYDLIAIMSGCAVFAFLPYCQLVRGNVVVDFFTTGITPRNRAILDTAGSLFYLLIAILFTWRLYFGMLELRSSGEVLANFNFYRWWTVPFNVFCMIVLIAVIAYTFVRDLRDVKKEQASA
jgi:TRAP-type C4-dicarboxylate transport system permease small subunit